MKNNTPNKESSLEACEDCRGEGSWAVECCDGSRNCPCQGKPNSMGFCKTCHGSGKNIKSIISQAVEDAREEFMVKIKSLYDDGKQVTYYNQIRNECIIDIESKLYE